MITNNLIQSYMISNNLILEKNNDKITFITILKLGCKKREKGNVSYKLHTFFITNNTLFLKVCTFLK